MPTRYQQLRQAIANLAAPAAAQAAYLDQLFSAVDGGLSAADYGNDELALEIDGIYRATGHMREFGEIAQDQIEAARPLDALLDRWSGEDNADFWTREALFHDPRWVEVRHRAQKALEAYPDEQRESDWTRQHAGSDIPVPPNPELISSLRARSVEALNHLRQARKVGDAAQAKAWATAFRRINLLRMEAGDDLNGPFD